MQIEKTSTISKSSEVMLQVFILQFLQPFHIFEYLQTKNLKRDTFFKFPI